MNSSNVLINLDKSLKTLESERRKAATSSSIQSIPSKDPASTLAIIRIQQYHYFTITVATTSFWGWPLAQVWKLETV
eukprot:scaffold63_cov306-Pinguiococcus_pyrenoidosus.AAC.91